MTIEPGSAFIIMTLLLLIGKLLLDNHGIRRTVRLRTLKMEQFYMQIKELKTELQLTREKVRDFGAKGNRLLEIAKRQALSLENASKKIATLLRENEMLTDQLKQTGRHQNEPVSKVLFPGNLRHHARSNSADNDHARSQQVSRPHDS